MYQITMCYGYWKSKRHEVHAVFDMFFRKSPFKGEFCIFAGLNQALSFLNTYKITQSHIDFLKEQMPLADPEFFEYLRNLDCKQIKVHAFKEGSVVFPREPLVRIEGPIAVCQLLETTLLCIVNYASLVATNAARMRVAVGPDKMLLEMGLRRAQGTDGGLSASRYAHIGGFDGTSNVLAGNLFGIKVSGTHAHAFVQSFSSLDDLPTEEITLSDGSVRADFVSLVKGYREKHGWNHTNDGELCAFIAYCQAFPMSFLALVDTYDTLVSGVPNFLACALAMIEIGCKPIGIRLDSGDLAYYSKEARKMFHEIEKEYGYKDFAVNLNIVASNDIDENELYKLQEKGHEINTFGIGTHLVTCQAQPALGCVYKLVETDGKARIKLSQDMIKVSVPGKKRIFRLFGLNDKALADIMMCEDEILENGPPKEGERILCRHILDPSKRAVCVPTRVVEMLTCVWDGKLTGEMRSVADVRSNARDGLESIQDTVKRRDEPIPYKVSLSERLFRKMHDLWMEEAPIAELI
mmetsp:Transcript_31072/g.76235  ORF Transcript_31072/g.76235 Transcript_31072/m.76235 type:complete len:522 (+) Transcript_31072:2-1567(+)